MEIKLENLLNDGWKKKPVQVVLGVEFLFRGYERILYNVKEGKIIYQCDNIMEEYENNGKKERKTEKET